MKKLEEKYKPAEQELFILTFVDPDFNFNSRGNDETELLYERVLKYDKTPSLKDVQNQKKEGVSKIGILLDMENRLAMFVYKFVKGFIAVYGNFLQDTMPLLGEHQPIKIFKTEFMVEFVNELKTLVKELEYFGISESENMGVNLEAYTLYQTKSGKASSERLEKFFKIFDSSIKNCKAIAFRLGSLLYKHNKFKQLIEQDEEYEDAIPDDKIISEVKDYAYPIPYSDKLVTKENKYHNGRTVLQIFREILILLVNFENILANLSPEDQIENRLHLIRKIEGALESTARLQAK